METAVQEAHRIAAERLSFETVAGELANYFSSLQA